jgi:hypothetical protein
MNEHEIGEKVLEERYHQSRIAKAHEILTEKGWKEYSRCWGDLDKHGELKSYPVTYTFKQPFFAHAPRYCVVPVYIRDTSYDDRGFDSASLVLVDIFERKIKSVFETGDRKVHYHGNYRVTPHALEIANGCASISFTTLLHADRFTFPYVSDSIWDKYFLYKKEHRAVSVTLEDLK